jgi:hypothetical protein
MSCVAKATLNWPNSDWNDALKWAEWSDPSGSLARLSTFRPLGP